MNTEEKIESIDWVTNGLEKEAITINMRISACIAFERKKMGLTRADLANKLKVAQYMIAKWESPDHDFTISELIKIDNIIDISKYLKILLDFTLKENENELLQ